MFIVDEASCPGIVIVTAHGRLSPPDYDDMAAVVDHIAERDGPIRMLLDLVSFRGWSPAAFWRDVRFNLSHRHAFERIAVLGDRRWKRWLTLLSRPLFSGTIRYFDRRQRADALDWLREP